MCCVFFRAGGGSNVAKGGTFGGKRACEQGGRKTTVEISSGAKAPCGVAGVVIQCVCLVFVCVFVLCVFGVVQSWLLLRLR